MAKSKTIKQNENLQATQKDIKQNKIEKNPAVGNMKKDVSTK